MSQEQTNITTGKQIRHLRTQLGMTQEELAGELNVTRQALSNWERDVNEPLEGEEFNHVFTQKELKGTGYEGKDVKIVNGEVYVDGRSAGIAIYLFVQNAKWVLVGLMANGTIQALVDYGPDVKAAYDYAKEIWAIYQNRVKAVYANVAAKTATASLKDGNICVRQSPNHYVCGYSLRPEEDSD